jgi:hypothetical protein
MGLHSLSQGQLYLNMPRSSILLAIHQPYGNDPLYVHKMRLHHTATEMSEATLVKLYQVNGWDKDVKYPPTYLI